MTELWNDLVVWGGFVLLLAAAALMIWRRLYREFPFLSAYFVAEIATWIVRRGFLVYVSTISIQYFYAYWLSEALIVILSFAVLYEIFLVRMFPAFHTTPFFRYLLPLVILLGFAIAIIIFVTAPAPLHGPHPLSVFVGKTTLALNFLQLLLLLFLSVILVTLGGGWEEHEYGITLGYGLYAITKLITTAVRAKAGYATTAVDQLPTIGYLVALVVWIIYLSREYKPPQLNLSMELVEKAQAWDRMLRDLMGRKRR
ncbi:MAG TPA: hypothetical protein VFR24_09895 [Candidatus Angelobacter sp.]|nr:hypothetical protein [Candidatus Angelobacter sp.]